MDNKNERKFHLKWHKIKYLETNLTEDTQNQYRKISCMSVFLYSRNE